MSIKAAFFSTILISILGCTAGQSEALKKASEEQSTAIGEIEPKYPVLLQRPGADTIKRLRALLPERGEAARVSLESKLKALNDTELTILRSNVNPNGRTVTQLSLSYRGVRVEDAFWKVHTDEDGSISYTSRTEVNAAHLEEIDVSPTVSPRDAEATALLYLGKSVASEVLDTYLLLAVQKKRYLLPKAVDKKDVNAADMAYRITGYTLQHVVTIQARNTVTGLHRWAVRVDAHSGAVVAKVDTLHRADPPISSATEVVTPLGLTIVHALLRNGRSQYVGRDFNRFVNVPQIARETSSGDTEWLLSDPKRGAGHVLSSYSGGNIVLNARGSVYHGRPSLWIARTGSSTGSFVNTMPVWGAQSGDGNFTSPNDDTTGVNWDSQFAQTAAVDVMYNMTLVYDMWKNVFDRRSYDNNDSSMVSFVHVGRGIGDQVYAMWDNQLQAMLVTDPPAGSQQWTETDLVAHELGHGLFQFDVMGGGLFISSIGEFGGISEANSDIWGVLAEYYEPEYSKSHVWSRPLDHIPNNGGNWFMGDKKGPPIRFLNFPTEIEWSDSIEADGMDSHQASGPISRMFYFLSNGAYQFSTITAPWASAHVPDGFDGIGNTDAANIWYLAIQDYVVPGETFLELREDCLAAASDLYGEFSIAYKAVEDAFAAVNIGDPALRTGPEVTLDVPIPHVFTDGTLTIPVEFAHPELYDIRKLTYILQGEATNGDLLFQAPGSPIEPVGMNPVDPLVPLTSLSSPLNLNFSKSLIDGFSLKLTVEVEDEYKNVTIAEARIDVRKPLFEVASKHLKEPWVSYRPSREEANFHADAWDESAVSHADFYQLSTGVITTDSVPPDFLSLSYICGSNLYKTVFGVQEPCETYNGYQFDSSIDTTFMPEGNYITQVVIHDMYGNSSTRYVPWAISRVEPTLTLDVTGTQVPSLVPTFKGEITLRSQWTSAFTTGNFIEYKVDSNDVTTKTPTGIPPGTWYDKTFSTLSLDNGPHLFSAWGIDKFFHIVERSMVFNVYNEDNAPSPLPTKEIYNEPPETNNDYTTAPFVPLSTDQIRGKYHYTYNNPVGGRADADPYRFSVPAGKMITFKTNYYCDPKVNSPNPVRDNGLSLATREDEDNGSWSYIGEFDGSQHNLSTLCSVSQSEEWILEAFFTKNGCKTTNSYRIDVEVANCTSSSEIKFDQCTIAPDCSAGQQCIDGGCQEVAVGKVYSECSADSLCDIYEGDCNADNQCSSNLACGDNNGPEFGYPNNVDICIPDSCSDGFTNFSETGLDCGGLCGLCISNPVGDPGPLFRSKFMR